MKKPFTYPSAHCLLHWLGIYYFCLSPSIIYAQRQFLASEGTDRITHFLIVEGMGKDLSLEMKANIGNPFKKVAIREARPIDEAKGLWEYDITHPGNEQKGTLRPGTPTEQAAMVIEWARATKQSFGLVRRFVNQDNVLHLVFFSPTRLEVYEQTSGKDKRKDMGYTLSAESPHRFTLADALRGKPQQLLMTPKVLGEPTARLELNLATSPKNKASVRWQVNGKMLEYTEIKN